MPDRMSHRLIARATGLEVETRARCQDDNHPPATYNPASDRTFCHCGRTTLPGRHPTQQWPDRHQRLTEHQPNYQET